MATKRPTLTVRAMAAILHLPNERKARGLRDQKYPKEGAQIFRTPYYSPALTGIRRFYRSGNAIAALAEARNKIESLTQESKRDNNQRVLDCFQKNEDLLDRKLVPQSNTRYVTSISDVELRLSPDLRALEGNAARYIWYHWKGAALTGRLAEDTLQIAHWVLEQNSIAIPISSLEFVDLFTGKVHKVRTRSSETEKLLRTNARAIDELWPTL